LVCCFVKGIIEIFGLVAATTTLGVGVEVVNTEAAFEDLGPIFWVGVAAPVLLLAI
jgi:hypothetical protein